MADSMVKRYRWPAILSEDHEVRGRPFLKGQQFIIAAVKDENGRAAPAEEETLAAPVQSLEYFYLIPVNKLNIGDRSVEEETQVIMDGVDITDYEVVLSPGLQVNDRFGIILLELAKGLRGNAGSLIALRFNRGSVNALLKDFENTFKVIYDGTPALVKEILSEDPIQLDKLRATYLYDAQGRETKLIEVEKEEKKLCVYLRHYICLDGDENLDAAYVGMTNQFYRRNQGHIKALKNPGLTVHYNLAATAQRSRISNICEPLTDHHARHITYLAEQLFDMYLDTTTDELKDHTTGILEARKPYRQAQFDALHKIRGIALAKLGYQPTVSKMTKGCNMEAPLYSMSTSRRSWKREEFEDRYIFTNESRHRVTVGESSGVLRLFSSSVGSSSLSLFVPKEFASEMQRNDRLVNVQIEIMKQSSHRVPWARCPAIGPVSNMALANSVAIRLTWKDENSYTVEHYLQTVQGLGRSYNIEMVVGTNKVEVPRAYVVAMKLRYTFLKQTLSPTAPKILTPYSITIMKANYEFNSKRLRLQLIPATPDDPEPGPSYRSLEENTEDMKEVYKLGMDENLSVRLRLARCDPCDLYARGWKPYAVPYIGARDLQCKVENGVCERWKFLNIPATWSKKEQLRFAVGAFYQRRSFGTRLIDEGYRYRNSIHDTGDDDDQSDIDDQEQDYLNSDSSGSEDDPSEIQEGSTDEDLGDAFLEAGDDLEITSKSVKDKAIAAATKYKFHRGTETDRILMVLDYKEEATRTLLLVILNNLDDECVYVDIADFQHQKDEARKYFAHSPGILVPQWARLNADDEEEELGSDDGDAGVGTESSEAEQSGEELSAEESSEGESSEQESSEEEQSGEEQSGEESSEKELSVEESSQEEQAKLKRKRAAVSPDVEDDSEGYVDDSESEDSDIAEPEKKRKKR